MIELIIKLTKYVFKNHLENIAEIDDFDQLKDYKKFRKDKLPIFSVLNQNDLDSIRKLIIYASSPEYSKSENNFDKRYEHLVNKIMPLVDQNFISACRAKSKRNKLNLV